MRDLIEKFKNVRVLVIGDALRDLYHFGHVDRLSPEAPVPIFIEDSQKARPGGAANVAANLEALGCQVDTIFAKEISTKHRYMVGHQQLFRVDKDILASPTEEQLQAARESQSDVIVFSDYAKGMLTPEMCSAARKYRRLVVVDPKGTHWDKYRGAMVICPNAKELSGVVSARKEFPVIMEKRGPEGITLWKENAKVNYPAVAREVFDVTGAGDTVVAVVAAVLGCGGMRIEEAARLANHAAGVVVRKTGTATCSKNELLEAL